MPHSSSPPILKDVIKETHMSLSQRRRWAVLGHWIGSLLPVGIVAFSALFVFRQAVVASIASTPHPELVYAILGTFLVGVLLTCVTLYRYTLEGNLLFRWGRAQPHMKKQLIAQLTWETYLLPMYQILLGGRTLNTGTRQAVVEQEIAAVNDRFADRLSLPNYLAGALVGLGLVGTFVGLLGTLEDLGKLFGALVQTSSISTNPTEIFSDMVRRLQDPMRGMGTAFVASLYGLLGSLVLGLQILAVGKIGHRLINQVHVLVRRAEISEQEHQLFGEHRSALKTTPDGSLSQSNQLSEMYALLRLQREQSQHETALLRREVLSVIQTSQALTEQILNKVTSATKESEAEQSKRWGDLSALFRTHFEQNHHETQILRREIYNATQASQSLAISVRESINADDRYRQSVPRTSYWQEAWVKVQAYLQRSNTDHTLNELSRISRQQSQLLSDISITLQKIEQRFRSQVDASFNDVA
jgi:hypothetical protein